MRIDNCELRIVNYPLPALSIAQKSTHAAGNAQRGHDGRQDADDELQDEFPCFLCHSGYRL